MNEYCKYFDFQYFICYYNLWKIVSKSTSDMHYLGQILLSLSSSGKRIGPNFSSNIRSTCNNVKFGFKSLVLAGTSIVCHVELSNSMLQRSKSNPMLRKTIVKLSGLGQLTLSPFAPKKCSVLPKIFWSSFCTRTVLCWVIL